jgi:hypothetical protein
MSDLLAKLKASRSATKKVTLPGTVVEFVLRVGTCAELQSATFSTEKHFREKGVDPNSMSLSHTYGHEETVQILAQVAMAAVGGEKRAFRDADECRIALSDDQRDYLASAYKELETEVSPRLDGLDDAAISAMAEEVKKNPDGPLSSFLSTFTLKRLARYLAAPPRTSQTGSGSTSS